MCTNYQFVFIFSDVIVPFTQYYKSIHIYVVTFFFFNDISYIICRASFSCFSRLKFFPCSLSSLNWQYQHYRKPNQNPDIKTLLTDNTCSPPRRGHCTPNLDVLPAEIAVRTWFLYLFSCSLIKLLFSVVYIHWVAAFPLIIT